jgi:hypothetical protein
MSYDFQDLPTAGSLRSKIMVLGFMVLSNTAPGAERLNNFGVLFENRRVQVPMSALSTNVVRGNVIGTYRNMIKLAKSVSPQSDSEKMLKMIRTQFRKEVSDPKEVTKLLAKAQSNISYMKMITPKASDAKDRGEQSFAVDKKDGSRVASRVHTNWTGSNMDPDSVARHNASLKRAGFRNNFHAKGGMF